MNNPSWRWLICVIFVALPADEYVSVTDIALDQQMWNGPRASTQMDHLLGRAKYFISISVRTIMFNFLTLFLFPLFPMFQFRCAASPVGQAAGKRINRDHRARCRLWNFQVKTDHSENIWLPTEWRNSQKKGENIRRPTENNCFIKIRPIFPLNEGPL